MYYVYLLKVSHPEKQYYIGSTSDLRKRIIFHQARRVQSTKGKLPVHLIYYECYNDKELALCREKNLKKSGSSYVGLLKRLKLCIEE